MRYFWDWMFTASDRAYTESSGGEIIATIAMLTDWADFEERKRAFEEKKFMTERQNDNQESSR